jgi:hypothetical protein
VVVLRPELFRVAIDTTEAPAGTRLAAPGRPALAWGPRRGVAPSPGGRQSRPGIPGPVPGGPPVRVRPSAAVTSCHAGGLAEPPAWPDPTGSPDESSCRRRHGVPYHLAVGAAR